MTTPQKVGLTILAAVVYWLLVDVALGLGHVDHRPTERSLANAFEQYNNAYFDGSLSPDTKVIIVDLSDRDDMGALEQREHGQWFILIDKKTHPLEKQAEMTLLHEMCHEYDARMGNYEGFDPGGHSNDAHESCMLARAQRGAFKGLW